MKAPWELPKPKQTACRHCGAQFLRYGVMTYNECPRCGLSLVGSVDSLARRKGRSGYLALGVGLALLVLSAIFLIVKRFH